MGTRVVIVGGAALLAPLLVACSGSGHPTAARTSAPTPIGRLDVATVRLARVGFCDRVAADDVRRALGGKPAADTHWGNGDHLPAEVTGGGAGDVTHELGCGWAGPAGAAARAWVFARPVGADFARTLVTAAAQPGCEAERAGVFGSPALLQTCTRPGGLQRVRRAGLFGDTWLTCELTGPAAPTLRSRADAWCAAVVSAVRTSS